MESMSEKVRLHWFCISIILFLTAEFFRCPVSGRIGLSYFGSDDRKGYEPMSPLNFKYVRIQGKELARNTMFAKGVFSMCWHLIQQDVMDEEDAGLFKEIDSWFAENLPWPPQCKNQEPVVCWFKTENSAEMLKMIRPALWLLERYHHPYYVVYTNDPGEIVYEDKYQVAARADGILKIDDIQPSWSPEE